MHSRNRRMLARRWPRRLAVASATAIVAGCAFFDPYVGVPAAPPEGWDKAGVHFAGKADYEIARIEAVRQDYLSRMQQMGRTKAAFATGSTLLTGWALYNGLKPNAPGVTETPIGDKYRTVRLGATITTAYVLSEYAVNKGQESAYNVGYQALTCLLRQSAPLLMPVEPIDASDEERPDNVKGLRRALDVLAARILELNRFVASAKVGLAEGNAASVQGVAEVASALIAANAALPDKPAKGQRTRKLSPEELSAAIADLRTPPSRDVMSAPRLDQTIHEAEKALAYAQNALADGEALLKSVSGSGREISERGHQIVATVNDLVHKAQPDLQAAGTALTSAQGIVSGFLKIGTQTAQDQAESNAGTNGGTKTNTSALPPEPHGPMTASARRPLRFAALGGPGVSLFGGTLAAVTLADSAATAAGAATSALDAAASATQKPVQDGKRTAVAKSTKPVAATLTVDELQKLNDAMAAALKSARQRQADDAEAKRFEGYVKQLDELSKPKDACLTRNHAPHDRCDADELAQRVEGLYAARRPVAATVLNFRSQAKAVRQLTGCQSDFGVQLTPSETIVARAGDSVSFVVTQPNPGSPVVMLQGALGDGLATLKPSSLGSAGLQAQVVFGTKASGRYTLLATDSTGAFSESTLIIVKPAPKSADAPDKPASAASAASASAS